MKYIQYKTLIKQQIFLGYCFGMIGYEELLACKARLVSEKESNPAVKLLVDLRDTEILITQDHIQEILSDQCIDSSALDGSDIALLISSPMAAVASLVFKNDSDGLHYFDLVFSTLTEALKHLNLQISYKAAVETAIRDIRRENR